VLVQVGIGPEITQESVHHRQQARKAHDKVDQIPGMDRLDALEQDVSNAQRSLLSDRIRSRAIIHFGNRDKIQFSKIPRQVTCETLVPVVIRIPHVLANNQQRPISVHLLVLR
jgi:hypothetical protein